MNSELRYHTTSGEWVLIVPGINKKPRDFKKSLIKRTISPKKSCPFENPQKTGNEVPHFWMPEEKPLSNWKLQVLANKFPALKHHYMECAMLRKDDMYLTVSGVGHHDLIITRDHKKSFSDLSDADATNVFKAFIKRYREFIADGCVKYVSMFQNWGPNAGASIFHPHYQIFAVPVIPHGVGRSLSFSREYWKEHGRCIHCDIIKKEIRDKKRIVYENSQVVAFVPFAAKEPFQVNIFPKTHNPYFEDSSPALIGKMSKALQEILASINKNLGDPDYNFFIHTAPIFKKKIYKHYHWHIEVIPKSNISAGFELSTGIEVNPMFPEDSAKILKIK